ncbi:MAG: hypothetical protein ACI8RD_009813, partial [Bacillariaceae sp.]
HTVCMRSALSLILSKRSISIRSIKLIVANDDKT